MKFKVNDIVDLYGLEMRITGVGEQSYLYISLTDTHKEENPYGIKELDKKGKLVKKKKLLAPALFQYIKDGSWIITTQLFKSLDSARTYYCESSQLIWPALPNKDGYYEVPDNE